MRAIRRLAICLFLCSSVASAADELPQAIEAQPATAGPDAPTVLEAVMVTGTQPGPGLWRVSRGDSVMWVVGTVSPLPKRMQWSADEVEARVAESAKVLLPPRVAFSTEGGMFRNMLLLPAALRARNNPEKERLQDVLPEALYSRWARLKAMYIGRSRSVEKRRPILASQKLQEEAFDEAGLSTRQVVEKAVERTAKRGKIPVEAPEIKIVVADPKGLLTELAAGQFDDLDCFTQTLDVVEFELPDLQQRANAWAVGDIDALRELPEPGNRKTCIDAVFGSEVAKRHGYDELGREIADRWLEAAEETMAKHATSFAILPMRLLLADDPDRYLAALAQRGYLVEAP